MTKKWSDFAQATSMDSDDRLCLLEWDGAATYANKTITKGNLFASMGAIGTTTPAAGTFTDVTANDLTLAAIDKIVASTANLVDVFVYDTRKDSDGGAWRKRCQHTSWYSELGEHPEVVIVTLENATPATWKIYDATDKDLAIWATFDGNASDMFFNAGNSAKRVRALNGEYWVMDTGGAGYVSFPGDYGGVYNNTANYRYLGNVTQRNDGLGYAAISTANVLVNSSCYDVGIAIRSGAQIDKVSGLPTPVVAIYTDGGVCVRLEDGRVVDVTGTTHSVAFHGAINDSDVYCSFGTATGDAAIVTRFPIPSVDKTGSALISQSAGGTYMGGSGSTYPLYSTADANAAVNAIALADDVLAIGREDDGTTVEPGVTLVLEDKVLQANSMQCRITKDHNTGWQFGDVKGAWLCDGTAETLTGSELVTNGGFAADSDWTKGTGWTIAAGVATGAAGSASALSQAESFTDGKTYEITYTVSNYSAGNVTLRLASDNLLTADTVSGTARSANGTYTEYLTADAASAWFGLYKDATFAGDVDDVTMRIVDEDRSYNGNGLAAYGSIVKNAAVTGAEAIQYTYSTSNDYLVQAYNSDLDPGTADFSIGGWFHTDGSMAAYNAFVSRAYWTGAAWSGNGHWFFYIQNNGAVRFDATDDNFSTEDNITTGALYTDDEWHFAMAVRRGNTLEIWVDGLLQASGTLTNAAGTLDNSSATLQFGQLQNASYPATDLGMRAWRYSAYAPTPEQIRFAYEREKGHFIANANSFLGGTTNVVQGIGYDDDTGRLFVATTDGTSVFSKDQRVDYIDQAGTPTSDNHKAVSASNGLYAIATAAETVAAQPARSLRAEVSHLLTHKHGRVGSTGTLTFSGVTTDATPTDIGKIIVEEGEVVGIRLIVTAREHADAITERNVYMREAVFYRDVNGNVTIQGTVSAIGTDIEVTGTADVTMEADTTAQTVDIKVTGHASKNIEWSARAEVLYSGDTDHWFAA